MNHSAAIFFRVFTGILVIFLTSFQAIAQSNTDYLVNPKGDTIPIKAIQPLEINKQIEEVNLQLSQFPKVIKAHKDIASLDSTLVIAFEEADTEEARLKDEEQSTSLRNLQDLKRQWEGYQLTLSKWQSTLTDRTVALETIKFEAHRIKLTWQKTKSEARNNQTLNESIIRIQDIVNLASDLEKRIKNRQDTVINYQNKVTDLQVRVNQALQLISKKRADLQSTYFIKDSPALWESEDSTTVYVHPRTQVRTAMKENINQITTFLKDHKSNNIVFIILFVAYLILLYALRRNFKPQAGDEEKTRVRNTQLILNYFPASATLLALLSILLVYSNIPMALREFSQILLLIPAILLLSRLLNKKLIPILYALAVLFILGEFHLLFLQKTIISRIILLLEGVFTFWLLIKVINKRSFLFKEINVSFRNLLNIIKPLYLLLLGIAGLANAFGYMNLAIILTNTVINSILVAVLLTVMVIVLDGLLISLFRTPLFLYSNIIKKNGEKLLVSAYTSFAYLAIFLWIRSILISLSIIQEVSNWIVGLFSYTWEVKSVSISIGGVLAFFLVILITSLVTKLVRVLMEEEIFPRIKLARGVPGAISMMVRYILVAFGSYVALLAAGIHLSEFSLMAGALGVGIGFGLQGIVSNFIAGLILSFERPVQKGDTVEIGTLMGDITNIGVRASTVRTYDGSEVIVPNSNLISNEVINWTLSDRKRRRVIPVAVAYGNNPRVVMDVLFKTAAAHPEVLDFPKPWALFDGFGDSSLNFRILFWVDFDRGLTVTSEVAINIYDALEKESINIPFPQQDLHIKSFDPTMQEVIFPWTKEVEKGKK